ncbi:MAG: thiamine diphosphokinase [Clostridia bacterium]|nr:thiamine diphosphokinase [Clostridia bacterium]
MNGICYIVGAGEFYSHIDKRNCDLVIAADGGYDATIAHNVPCDLLVGDMDSISGLPYGVEILRVPVEKDETDTYLCYLEGVRRGYTDFVIFGGVGGRDDHTFANYSLLIGAIKQGHRVTLVGERFNIFAIANEKFEISGCAGRALSVFAFSGDAEGVSISGCKYTAEKITLSPMFPLGVSNTVTEERASVEVERGVLLLMLER